jgi:hypothetical protein
VPALDLEWDLKLNYRPGSETRLAGIDVYYEFRWRDVFDNGRTQFKNGQCLAELVSELCPPGRKPALLLTLRNDVRQGFRHTPKHLVFVVNIAEYRSTHGDAARSYIASHLQVEITDIDQLHELVGSADPELVKALIESSMTIEHIAAWARDNQERLDQLSDLVAASPNDPPSFAAALAAIEDLNQLGADDLTALTSFLRSDTDPQQRIEILRAATDDPTGRYVTGQVLIERTPQRVEDARQAMANYEGLLDDETSTETTMQHFIEGNLWLLGLDYAVMSPRRAGVSGTMDFILQRYDGFHDLLELKSPHDELIRAPDAPMDGLIPSPHQYALSPTLGQALAQALVYRDRLTRHAAAAGELYGLPQARDPRLIIVMGKVGALPEHRAQVLRELNKSLHRVEVVPYDVLAMRARAMLDNVEAYFTAAQSDVGEPG